MHSRIQIGDASVDHGQLDVAHGSEARQQVVGLEDEPQFAIADLGELVAAHVADLLVVEVVCAGGGLVEAADVNHWLACPD
jgi:hypothetical protein